MIWDPASRAGVQKAVDGFEAKYPKIKVDVQQVRLDRYSRSSTPRSALAQGPDVMRQSSLVSQYANGGALAQQRWAQRHVLDAERRRLACCAAVQGAETN